MILCIRVFKRSLVVIPRTLRISNGISSSLMTFARMASSISWLIYAILSDKRTIFPSSVCGIILVWWFNIPSRTSHVRFSPLPSFSSFSTIRTLCSLWRYPSSHSSFKIRSPAWPNGVCPKSWPNAMASTKSSFRRSAFAMVRAFCDTSNVWVRRVL